MILKSNNAIRFHNQKPKINVPHPPADPIPITIN